MDYFIWSILEANACATRHGKIDSLKMSLGKAWAARPQSTVRAAAGGHDRRLKAVVRAKGVTWSDM